MLRREISRRMRPVTRALLVIRRAHSSDTSLRYLSPRFLFRFRSVSGFGTDAAATNAASDSLTALSSSTTSSTFATVGGAAAVSAPSVLASVSVSSDVVADSAAGLLDVQMATAAALDPAVLVRGHGRSEGRKIAMPLEIELKRECVLCDSAAEALQKALMLPPLLTSQAAGGTVTASADPLAVAPSASSPPPSTPAPVTAGATPPPQSPPPRSAAAPMTMTSAAGLAATLAAVILLA